MSKIAYFVVDFVKFDLFENFLNDSDFERRERGKYIISNNEDDYNKPYKIADNLYIEAIKQIIEIYIL